ncbi:MAG TPA: tRNA lysidine(34) synthetase TilS [Ferrovibrio sp.]|uniref:tRNA lysidine(34) synthetase TilS n=1 Tax=Ferrovibrio sp. TaxID=1917215 RepID=UPI002B4B5EE0|nr:tRNA lysidine(34) synthetase TilS [Ferrovibrio sp.]HLT77679.1 tRNA lysidine(34) synthetase TilS [Ferrovibrio sp.]
MAGAGALGAAEFARLLKPLLTARPARIAVAVSGGADSLALTLLAQHWAARHRVALTAFTVDHRLRPESGREARQVARWLKARGIDHRILVWTHDGKPAANLQADARAARYALLQAECRRRGIMHLLLAHHRDDQAETLLLRSLRGSGVDGLAGMMPLRELDDGLMLLRPLLEIPKARLVATCRRHRQEWIEDPSNDNAAFARVRVRQALDLLSGGDAAAHAELTRHLAQSAANLARARAALTDAAYSLLRACVTVLPSGIAWLDPAPLADAHEEVSLRALSRLLMAIGGQPLPPRLERLERLRENLMQTQSLHRCSLRLWKDGRILVCREARHLPEPLALKPGKSLLWDGRFRVETARGLPAGLVLQPLGALRPPDVDAEAAARLPRPAWASQPAIMRGGRLLAVPGLGHGALPKGLTLAFRPRIAAGIPTGTADSASPRTP